MGPRSELERLLDDDRWIRRLAGRLVADPAAADDLAQEAWLAALGAGGAAGVERRWFGRVLRNSWKDLLRGRARRAAREAAVARPASSEPADELVAELELRERVARALRELEEPLRSTLVRRFLRDESLGAIARADGVAVSTVHERLERGLARLRTRLDAEHGGRRAAWATTLVGLARRAGGGLGPVEILTMASGIKLAAGAALVGVVALWWTGGSRAATDEAPPEEARAARLPAAPAHPVAPPTLPAAPRETRTSAPAPAPAESPASGPRISGRVVDPGDHPVAGVEIVWNGAETTSGADGVFGFAGEPEGAWGRLHCDDPGFVTLVAGALRGEEFVVAVAPARDFAGVVLAEDGRPVAGASLAFRPRASLFPALGLQVSATAVSPRWDVVSDAEGRFEMPGLAGGPHLGLEVRALGYLPRPFDLPEGGATDLAIRLTPDRGARAVSGRVLGPDGEPVAGARVSAGDEIVTTDAEGAFALVVHPVTRRITRDERGVWRPEPQTTVRVVALAEGRAPAHVAFPYAEPPTAPIVLRLGAEPLSISGTVVDPEGRPLSEVILWPRELTPFGRVPRGLDGVDQERTLEGELSGGSGSAFGTTSFGDGSFVLEALDERLYDLELFDPRTSTRRSVPQVAAGTRGLTLVLAPEPHTVRVAGRVVASDGTPRAAIRIQPRRGGFEGKQPPQLATYWRETDADGRFEFEALATEGTILDVFAQPWQWIPLDGRTDLEALEIVVPRLCELQVVLEDPGRADALGVLDAQGVALEMVERLHMDGQSVAFTMDARAAFEDGRSSVLQVPETARTLVLYRGRGAAATEVQRLPLALDRTHPTVVRP